MTSYAIRRGDAVRYMSVPEGAFAARHADSHGHRPWKHLDLRKHARMPAPRLGQRRITEAEDLPCRGRNDSTAASFRRRCVRVRASVNASVARPAIPGWP